MYIVNSEPLLVRLDHDSWRYDNERASSFWHTRYVTRTFRNVNNFSFFLFPMETLHVAITRNAWYREMKFPKFLSSYLIRERFKRANKIRKICFLEKIRLNIDRYLLMYIFLRHCTRHMSQSILRVCATSTIIAVTCV